MADLSRRRFLRQFLLQATGGGVLSLGSCKEPRRIASERLAPDASSTIRIIVSAAASMQDVLRALQTAYGAIEPTVEITYNFGSSGSLAQQIIQGAPVDIFLSASPRWIDTLDHQGHLAPQSRRALVNNSMVLVVPKDGPAQGQAITGFQDLFRANKIAIGEPESVPAGGYAKEVLTAMNLFEKLKSRLVFGKNVRHVLAYVETGHVDAGLVYGTDALISQRVKAMATAPAHSHGTITYGVALVNGSAQRTADQRTADQRTADQRTADQRSAAQALINFLGSAPALKIFQRHGFVAVE